MKRKHLFFKILSINVAPFQKTRTILHLKQGNERNSVNERQYPLSSCRINVYIYRS